MSMWPDTVKEIGHSLALAACAVGMLFCVTTCCQANWAEGIKVDLAQEQTKQEAIRAGLIQGRDGWERPVNTTTSPVMVGPEAR